MALSVKEKIKSVFQNEAQRSSQVVKGRKLNFKVLSIYDSLLEQSNEFEAIYLNLSNSRFLTSKYSKKALIGLIRFSFLCQPVNDEVSSTIFNLRWQMSQDDSRYSSFENCVDIFNYALDQLNSFLDNLDDESAEDLGHLFMYLDNPSCPNDVPFDYVSMSVEKIHEISNIAFYSPPEYLEVLKLRVAFKTMLKDVIPKKILGKIDVCSYKTERAQTGLFKTNREYRWETVSGSPQGASKKMCWDIEVKLMKQICEMENFPQTVEFLEDLGELERGSTLCPVMLEKLDFNDLIEEGNNTTHGESAMQLGHLKPKSNTLGAHNRDNVSWISKEGNRIQGNNSIKETHDKIIDLSSRIIERRDDEAA